MAVGRLPAGPTNTLADVPGTRVGHKSLIRGDGPLRVGEGPVRTGVSAVVPPGTGPWPAATHVINGYGKTMGLLQVDETGLLETPIFLTNTLAVGAVQQGYLTHLREKGQFSPDRSLNVVVAECHDGYLNDLWGLHVRPEDAVAALEDAQGRLDVEMGSVGAGVGMSGFGWKGGVGSASRRLSGGAHLGAFVLLNCGRQEDLQWMGRLVAPWPEAGELPPDGSIIILLATDAAADPFFLKRVARRATHGLARTGATSAGGSGDIVVAWSSGDRPVPGVDDMFLAAIEATEEAIWNALLTAGDMTGRDGNTRKALSHELLLRGGRF